MESAGIVREATRNKAKRIKEIDQWWYKIRIIWGRLRWIVLSNYEYPTFKMQQQNGRLTWSQTPIQQNQFIWNEQKLKSCQAQANWIEETIGKSLQDSEIARRSNLQGCGFQTYQISCWGLIRGRWRKKLLIQEKE